MALATLLLSVCIAYTDGTKECDVRVKHDYPATLADAGEVGRCRTYAQSKGRAIAAQIRQDYEVPKGARITVKAVCVDRAIAEKSITLMQTETQGGGPVFSVITVY